MIIRVARRTLTDGEINTILCTVYAVCSCSGACLAQVMTFCTIRIYKIIKSALRTRARWWINPIFRTFTASPLINSASKARIITFFA